jgi:hypothetical protein
MQMKGKLPSWLAGVALIIIVLETGWVVSGQPARDRIIENVTMDADDDQVTLEVELSYVFRYLSHFPQRGGSELRIRIRPVRVPISDSGAVFKNEGMVPPDAGLAAVDQVVYEGDSIDGPWLTIYFTRPVHYEVIPGSDYRSIYVIVQKPVETTPDAAQP